MSSRTIHLNSLLKNSYKNAGDNDGFIGSNHTIGKYMTYFLVVCNTCNKEIRSLKIHIGCRSKGISRKRGNIKHITIHTAKDVLFYNDSGVRNIGFPIFVAIASIIYFLYNISINLFIDIFNLFSYRITKSGMQLSFKINTTIQDFSGIDGNFSINL